MFHRNAITMIFTLVLAAAIVQLPSAQPPAVQTPAQPIAGQSASGRNIPAADGVQVYIEIHAPHPAERPMIVLCHEENWSRGEFRDTWPRLNEMGYNCMTVDLRNGGQVRGAINQTAQRLKSENRTVDPLDIQLDIVAALRYVKLQSLAKGPIVLLGSSHSASIALVAAAEHPDLVNGVMAFSPAEYFTQQGKPATWVADHASRLRIPVFFTSTRAEIPRWANIQARLAEEFRHGYIPADAGEHGARALWPERPEAAEVWKGVLLFLQERFPIAKTDEPAQNK